RAAPARASSQRRIGRKCPRGSTPRSGANAATVNKRSKQPVNGESSRLHVCEIPARTGDEDLIEREAGLFYDLPPVDLQFRLNPLSASHNSRPFTTCSLPRQRVGKL